MKSVWYVVLPGDEPVESCQVLLEDHLPESIDGLEPIEGTVELSL